VPVFRVDVLQRSQLEIELEGILDRKLRRAGITRSREVVGPHDAKSVVESDKIQQEQRAVMVVVITDPPI